MKIIHLCLASVYADNYGYQENILPKIHQIQGHEVKIIASVETWNINGEKEFIRPSQYVTEDNVSIVRIGYWKFLPNFIERKLRIYQGFRQYLKEFNPDILFIHGVQFLGIIKILFYKLSNPKIKIIIDNHADKINSEKNFVSKYILNFIIYRICAKLIEPYTDIFYGVLPSRVDYLVERYGITRSKVHLLPMGGDDTLFDLKQSSEIKMKFKKKWGLNINSRLIITGGKYSGDKSLKSLLDAFEQLSENFSLIIFGVLDKNNQDLIEKCLCKNRIVLLGWLNNSETYESLIAADLGIFLNTHSVLWEQALSVGLPCLFKKWDKLNHLNFGGNCIEMEDVSSVNVKNIIEHIFETEAYTKMLKVSSEKGPELFSYSQIAKKSLEV